MELGGKGGGGFQKKLSEPNQNILYICVKFSSNKRLFF